MNEDLLRLDESLYVSISEPRRYKDSGARRRIGFAQRQFEQQRYVVVTLTDHSSGHGIVKAFTLRNPHPEFIAKINDPRFWEVRKNNIILVTEQAQQVERTFRTVFLRTANGDQLMTNSLDQQIKNLAANAQVRVDGEDHAIVGYINPAGNFIKLVDDDDDDDDEEVPTTTAKAEATTT